VSRAQPHRIARIFRSPTTLLVGSLLPSLSAVRLATSLFLCFVDVTPAVPLPVSLASFSCQRLSRYAACFIARFPQRSTTCLWHRSMNRSFLSLADVLSTTPIAVSLVSFLGRRLPHRTTPLDKSLVSLSYHLPARYTARCIVRFFLPPTTRP
jgi:hypothetical protein